MRLVLIGLGIVSAVVLVEATLVVETRDAWLYRGGFLSLAVVLVALLVGAGQDGPNPLARVLSIRPLVGLGLISYGVYLWHWPIAVWVTEEHIGFGGLGLFVVRSVITLGVALASYWLVEQPIRRRGLQRLGRARPVVVGFSIAACSGRRLHRAGRPVSGVPAGPYRSGAHRCDLRGHRRVRGRPAV